MVASEMADVLSDRYPGEPAARDFRKLVDQLTTTGMGTSKDDRAVPLTP